MGKFIEGFKKLTEKGTEIGKKVGTKVTESSKKIGEQINQKINEPEKWQKGRFKSEDVNKYIGGLDDFEEDLGLTDNMEDLDPYIDNVQPAQKPASFHHFILENQYKDLEKSIRGYKDVFNKYTQKWEIKRKAHHCFTDEEAEEILRTAQSHLSTDIKLTYYDKRTFGVRFMAIYDKIEFLFKRIMEYRFGRFGDPKKQGEMKEQALKIFIELITRIEANYSRAIQGAENKLTHDSVKSQESLQGLGDEVILNKGYT